jgi:hypothetical protein
LRVLGEDALQPLQVVYQICPLLRPLKLQARCITLVLEVAEARTLKEDFIATFVFRSRKKGLVVIERLSDVLHELSSSDWHGRTQCRTNGARELRDG